MKKFSRKNQQKLQTRRLVKSVALIGLCLALVISPNYMPFNQPIPEVKAVGSSLCTSEACKQAEAAELEATEKANNAESAANTLQDEVLRINNEIAMYEARIAANTARAEDLQNQIEDNTAKLDLQQKALANLLVDIHFDDNADTLLILAGSKSISDFAEKQERVDTAKNEVNESAQTVKTLKEQLETQKTEVDRIIADQEIQRNALNAKRAYEQALILQYQDNAAQYAADAEAARKVQEEEIEKARQEMQRQLGTGEILSGGVNTYPAKDECPQGNLNGIVYGGYKCQCVSYTGWMAYRAYGVFTTAWGNANTWDDTARALGYRVDSTPEVGSIAQTDFGYWGHVMWVEAVNSDGSITVSEYNGGAYADFSVRRLYNPSAYNYIHFR